MKFKIFCCLLLATTNAFASNESCDDQGFINQYLAKRNCLLESHNESCDDLIFTPELNVGIVSGLGALLIQSRFPDVYEGMKRIEDLQKKVPDFRTEALKIVESTNKDLEKKKLKFLEQLESKYKKSNNAQALNDLSIFKKNLGSPDLRMASDPQLKEDLKKFYNDQYVKSYNSKINKLSSPVWENLNASERLKFLEYPNLFNISSQESVLKKYFKSHYTAYQNIQNESFQDTKKRFLKANPNMSLSELDELIASNNDSNKKFLEFESLRDQVLDENFRKAGKPAQIIRNFKSFPNLGLFANEKIKIPGFSPQYKPRSIFKKMMTAGAIGALGGVATNIVLNEKSKIALKSCRRELGLSNEELDFLNNSDTFLSASLVKSDQFRAACDSFYFENPEDSIEKMIKKFGKIPTGICKLIVLENNKMKKNLTDNLNNIKASCVDNKVSSDGLSIDFNGKNPLATINISRPDGDYQYVAPIYNNDSFPDLKFAKVLKKNKEGVFEENLQMTNDIHSFMNILFPPTQIIELGNIPDEGFKSKQEEQLFMNERSRKYNAYIKKNYWSFHNACKGYNNIECDVLSKAFSATPLVRGVDTLCFDNKRFFKSLENDGKIFNKAMPR